jgi:hypothetical protein
MPFRTSEAHRLPKVWLIYRSRVAKSRRKGPENRGFWPPPAAACASRTLSALLQCGGDLLRCNNFLLCQPGLPANRKKKKDLIE